MTHQYTITGMTCSGCVSTVQKALQKVKGVDKVSIDLQKNEASVTMTDHLATSDLQKALASLPHYELYDLGEAPHPQSTKSHSNGEQKLAALPSIGNRQTKILRESSAPPRILRDTDTTTAFWSDANTWRRASFNTLNCLIGCSIGDFGMIIFLQSFYPATSMSVQMILAVIAGLATSVAFESILLRTREQFAWGAAFRTALSMSFISMVAMEVVMNFTDFMITGGKAAFGNPMYWTALGISMIAGFLAPLPYNYYKLKKYNKACH